MSTTTDLSNSIRARYWDDYITGAWNRRLYDQVCFPIGEDAEKMQRGSSHVVNFIGRMVPGSTAMSESVDITPQTLSDATVTVTPSSRGEAIQDSELLLIQNYTGYNEMRSKIVGENQMETIEAYLLETLLSGAVFHRASDRADIDAGTSGDRLSDSSFAVVANKLQGLKCPEAPGVMGDGQGSLFAIMAPDVYWDLLSGGNIVSIAQYQDKSILMNKEVGYIAPFRIIQSPWAKVFAGAGANNGSGALATTLAAAGTALDKTMTVAADANCEYGEWLTVGSEETSTTYYPTNERVRRVSETSDVITFVGSGDNGGFRYDHANGVAVRNADSVYPVIFAGPKSIAKVYASEIGEYGQIVGPNPQGLADQWVSLAWKWYGGFGIISENWLARGEFSSSLDA